MRTTFIETLVEIAAQRPKLFLLTGDLGYSVLEKFGQTYPDRYLNVGVAEQNMTGIAAGMAMCGNTVVTYSIANFPTLRCLEQIRNDVCYHNADVKIVAVGGGLAYASLGYTHHGVEDLGILRVLPNMTVFAPGDPAETRAVTRALFEIRGPCYLRLGKAGEPAVHTKMPEFQVGRAIPVRWGRDITLASTGGMLATVVAAADALKERGISAAVLSYPTVWPFDNEAICQAVSESGRIITAEEHGPGGLGTLAAEAIAGAGLRARFTALRLARAALTTGGSQQEMRAACGLDVASIVEAAGKLL
jgi:transketolase